MFLCVEIGDIDAVRDELYDFNNSEWKDLARGLGLRRAQVDRINADYKQDGVGECLCQVLEEWLKQNHNVARFGLPTWQSLASAVEQSDCALAAKIRAKR